MFDIGERGGKAVQLEFQKCNLDDVSLRGSSYGVAGLFAGIGGIELGLSSYGGHAHLLCENWDSARAVLQERFPAATPMGDVRDLRALPKVDLVTAGFPCTDLSQAGRTRGIAGDQSGLVGHVFRLLRHQRVPVLLLENVPNMLVLDRGSAMHYLVNEIESLGYRWAYRVVDSRFTGVPQRRQRVILVAAREIDPRAVLLADDAGEPAEDWYRDDAYGFFWTEGLRGLGWARDAVPTLKGGSTIGIPSPPAIWYPTGRPGHRVVIPSISDAERLQGFSPGWTEPAEETTARKGTRWKLVGNAVTVGVAQWVGERLIAPGEPIVEGEPLLPGDSWPTACWGASGQAWKAKVSMWPLRRPYRHLAEAVDLDAAAPLSAKASAGFLKRARSGNLRFLPRFLDDIESHIMFHEGGREVA